MYRELAGLPAAAVGEAVKAEISARGTRFKLIWTKYSLNTPAAFKTDGT